MDTCKMITATIKTKKLPFDCVLVCQKLSFIVSQQFNAHNFTQSERANAFHMWIHLNRILFVCIHSQFCIRQCGLAENSFPHQTKQRHGTWRIFFFIRFLLDIAFAFDIGAHILSFFLVTLFGQYSIFLSCCFSIRISWILTFLC